MGLFSKLRNSITPNSREDEIAKAVIAMPLLVAAADGKIEESELHQITNLCAFSPIFHTVGVDRTRKLIEENMKTLKSQGAEHLFSSVLDTLSPELRETAICFAIRTALADGELADSELDMLKAMGSRMEIPEDTFLQIFKVLVMLQRGPNA